MVFCKVCRSPLRVLDKSKVSSQCPLCVPNGNTGTLCTYVHPVFFGLDCGEGLFYPNCSALAQVRVQCVGPSPSCAPTRMFRCTLKARCVCVFLVSDSHHDGRRPPALRSRLPLPCALLWSSGLLPCASPRRRRCLRRRTPGGAIRTTRTRLSSALARMPPLVSTLSPLWSCSGFLRAGLFQRSVCGW